MHGVEISDAAQNLSKHTNIDFKVCVGWLWWFRNCHGICNRVDHREARRLNTAEVEPFRLKLSELTEELHLSLSELYGDETGLLWRYLPKMMTKILVRKKVKIGSRFPVLFTSADGMHQLIETVVRRSAHPRVLKDYMLELPVHCFHSKRAWLMGEIFQAGFPQFHPRSLSLPTAGVKEETRRY